MLVRGRQHRLFAFYLAFVILFGIKGALMRRARCEHFWEVGMKRKMVFIAVIAVMIFGVFFAFVFLNSDMFKKNAQDTQTSVDSLNRNEDGVLIVSIDTNPEFFENAKTGTLDEWQTYTSYSETPYTVSAGIELSVKEENLEDEMIYEPYILVVPEELDGEKVVYFRINADDYVREIELPAGCQDISITNCSALEKVTCSDTIIETNIYNCGNLREFVFPEDCYSLEIIGSFNTLPALEYMVFPSSVEYVSISFAGMESLKSLELNDGLQEIEGSFKSCNSIEKIDIPESVVTISDSSFSGCDALKEITLHDGLETINNSFKNCPALETLDIPDSVTRIDGESFAGCDNLTLIVGHDTAAEEYAIENDIPYQYRDEL